MTGNIVLWLSLCWMPAMLYLMLRNETKFKKNIAVGVTLPFEGRRHPDVLRRLEQFKKQELWLCIVMTLLCVPGLFLEYSLSFSLWFFWMLLCIAVPYIPYVLCNRDLKRIKAENGWSRVSAGSTVTVDLGAVPEPNWISPWAFLPAVVLSLLPLLPDTDFAFLYLTDTAMVVLCWLGYRYLFRNKAEAVDNNTELTIVLTRIRRCQWGKLWLLCAYSMAVMNWLAYLTMYSPAAMTMGITALCIVLVGASMHIEFQTRRLQEKLTANSGRDFYVDDDDKWIGGLVYYNLNDDRVLINDRVGTNSSVNLAKPAGKVIYAALALLLVTLPLWGLVLGNGEIKTDLSVDAVTIKGGMHEYVLTADEVTRIELLEELPAITRTAGTGMPEFLGGNFSSKDYGKLKVCLNPTAPPYLLIETAEETYLLGTNDEVQTMEIYDALK